MHMLFKERFARFELGVKGSLVGSFPLGSLMAGFFFLAKTGKIAVC